MSERVLPGEDVAVGSKAGTWPGDGLMGTPDVNESRRQPYELEETHRWAHHVADLNSGQVLTFLLERPITPLSRAERLSRLGRVIDPSIFRGPSYTLTPRTPYQASP